MPQKNQIAIAKRNCGIEAVKLVEDGMVLGLGSGSTVLGFIKALVTHLQVNPLDICAVPTSYDTVLTATDHGLRLISPYEIDSVDLAIDGADEVDPQRNLIKGAGGAFTWEKIVATSAKTFLILIDFQKQSPFLGMNAPVPVEVLPVALRQVTNSLADLGATPSLRTGSGKLGPVVTDFGNLIVDAKFEKIQNPLHLEHELNQIPGVVENGIFAGKTPKIIIGYPDKVETLGFAPE